MNYLIMQNLSIAIPTRNRMPMLLDILKIKNSFFKTHNIEVYIYDESDDKSTKEAILEFIAEGNNNIHYSYNEGEHGHDFNIRRSLFETPGDYVYLMGDGLLVEESALEKILLLIDQEYDLILMNSKNQEDLKYNDSNKFYLENGWQATLTGASVYKRSTIERAKSRDMSKYMNLLYFQYGVIFEGLDFDNSSTYVIAGENVKSHSDKGRSFALKNYFQIFCSYWVKMNENLPIRYEENKEEVIQSFDVNTGWLSTIPLLAILRKDGYLNKREYMEYKEYVDRCVDKNIYFNIFIIFPKLPLRISYSLFSKLS